MATAEQLRPPFHTLVTMLRKLFSSRLTKALSGQALVSIFHFSINLLLLPLLAPYDYGVFALSFVLAMFAAAINNALISTPLSIYTPIIKTVEERQKQEALFNALNTLFFIGVISAGILFALREHSMALPVALFVASYATRQFSRSFAYARLKAEVPARADTLYVIVSIIGTALSITFLGASATPAILLSLAVGNTAATLLEFYQLKDAWRLPSSFRALLAYKLLWPQTRWALIGAFTTLLMGQAHSIIVSSSFGPSAFAPLAAGGVLFGPIRVALTTWQNMSKPQMAIDLDAKRFYAVNQTIRRATLVLSVTLCLVAAALWLFWPVIHDLLYAKKYGDEPMWFIVSLWTIITLFFTLNAPVAAALQALADFKVLAIASIFGSILSIAIVITLLFSNGPASTLYGAIAAEIFMTAYLFYNLSRSFARQQ